MGIQFGRKISLVAVLLCAVGITSGFATSESPDHDKVALVNGTAITNNDYQTELQRIVHLRSNGKNSERTETADVRKQAIENLVVRELLYQAAIRRGITIPASVLNEQIADLEKMYNGKYGLTNALQKQGLSEAVFREQIERGMVIHKFIDIEVSPKVTVPEDEIRNYYAEHKAEFKKTARVRISQILIKTDPLQDIVKREAGRNRLEKIRRRLLAGEDFARVAKETSECGNCKPDGDLGYFEQGQLTKGMEDAVSTLKQGEVSGILEDKFGLHILKLVDRVPSSISSIEDVKFKIRENLLQTKRQKALAPYLKDLRRDAKVEILLNRNEE